MNPLTRWEQLERSLKFVVLEFIFAFLLGFPLLFVDITIGAFFFGIATGCAVVEMYVCNACEGVENAK